MLPLFLLNWNTLMHVIVSARCMAWTKANQTAKLINICVISYNLFSFLEASDFISLTVCGMSHLICVDFLCFCVWFLSFLRWHDVLIVYPRSICKPKQRRFTVPSYSFLNKENLQVCKGRQLLVKSVMIESDLFLVYINQ